VQTGLRLGQQAASLLQAEPAVAAEAGAQEAQLCCGRARRGLGNLCEGMRRKSRKALSLPLRNQQVPVMNSAQVFSDFFCCISNEHTKEMMQRRMHLHACDQLELSPDYRCSRCSFHI